MRWVLFSLVSVLLHAAALTYPIFFFALVGEPVIPVVVVSLSEGDGNRLNGQGGVGKQRDQPAGQKRRARVTRTEEKSSLVEKPTASGTQMNAAAKTAPNVSPGLNTLTFPEAQPAESIDVGASHGASSLLGTERLSEGLTTDTTRKNQKAGTEVASSAPRGDGTGEGGSRGRGNSAVNASSDTRREDGATGLVLARPSYTHNPKPEYPERARREGWQGTVLLRVLVDEKGNSKSIEVNRSSGFEALDHAAIQTVTRWRFSPARYGERRVESWVRIPIVFRLADLRE
ncbi:MAG: energy transducer TonB [Deltaproteobacteria bacterium]|nr:energy transducer TonB [Deltaproteobacteria bacterium]